MIGFKFVIKQQTMHKGSADRAWKCNFPSNPFNFYRPINQLTDRPSNQPTDQPTEGQLGSFHFNNN